jgi:release factor glutamine methyltransferase
VSVSAAKIAGCRVTGVDISAAALNVARINVERHGVSRLVTLVESDLFGSLAGREGEFDFIVSNPPYIKTAELDGLPDLRAEPRAALDGGEDGLYFYREISKTARKFMRPGGRLIFEVGRGQAAAVSGIMKKNCFGDIKLRNDLNGCERVVEGGL